MEFAEHFHAAVASQICWLHFAGMLSQSMLVEPLLRCGGFKTYLQILWHSFPAKVELNSSPVDYYGLTWVLSSEWSWMEVMLHDFWGGIMKGADALSEDVHLWSLEASLKPKPGLHWSHHAGETWREIETERWRGWSKKSYLFQLSVGSVFPVNEPDISEQALVAPGPSYPHCLPALPSGCRGTAMSLPPFTPCLNCRFMSKINIAVAEATSFEVVCWHSNK